MATTTRKRPAGNTAEMSEKLSEAIEVNDKVELNFKDKKTTSAKIPDDALINVRSNSVGEMHYIDSFTKEEFIWDHCGVTITMPMVNLRHMKQGANIFFENNMIVMLGFADENADKFAVEDIYNSLFVSKYYEHYLDPSDVSDILNLSETQLRERVSMMSNVARIKLVVTLNTYIEKGVLDSLRAIRTFEKVLGCSLKMPE